MGVGGTGTQTCGVTAAQLAEAQRRQAQQDENKAAAAAAAAAYSPVGGNGPNGGTSWAPSVGIPDNFWGFVILTLGLR